MKVIPSLSRWDEIVDAADGAELDDIDTRAVDTQTWVEPISRLGGTGGAAMNDAPTRRRSGDSLFQSLMRLWPGEGRRPQASARAMAKLRSAFRASVNDLATEADAQTLERVSALLRHIVHARHPQDLWHLRTAIYTEVARGINQAEAEARLIALNRQLAQSKSLLRRLLG